MGGYKMYEIKDLETMLKEYKKQFIRDFSISLLCGIILFITVILQFIFIEPNIELYTCLIIESLFSMFCFLFCYRVHIRFKIEKRHLESMIGWREGNTH